MKNLALCVSQLGKRYRLGAKAEPYHTLRDTIAHFATAPFKHRTSPEAAFWALKNVSFDLRRGDVLGIIGGNGAGKTTLLKLLSRITRPTAGTAEIWGRVGSLLEVGTGFHQELTGRENIYLNGAILGMARADIRRRLDEIVAFAEVERFLDTPVKRYSTGMYMRLAFAVAAHLEPDILIVDEVLAVGDVAFQKKCLGKMGEVANHERTILFVSHNMAAVAELCRTVLWLDQGTVKRAGRSSEVIAEYLSSHTTVNSSWTNPLTVSKQAAITEAARITSLDGQPATVVAFSDGFHIEVYYRVREPRRGMLCFCQITDSAGHMVFESYDTDTGKQRSQPAGRYRSTCLVPAALLRPGRYSLNVGTIADVVCDEHRHVLTFEISAVGYAFDMGRWGVITPVLQWTVHSCGLNRQGAGETFGTESSFVSRVALAEQQWPVPR